MSVHPTSDLGRYLDLMKQGFMKPLPKPRVRKDGKRLGTPPPMVSCCGCENWHRKGLHTREDAAERRASFRRYQEKDRKADIAVRTKMEEVT